jgi:hypothetical protein
MLYVCVAQDFQTSCLCSLSQGLHRHATSFRKSKIPKDSFHSSNRGDVLPVASVTGKHPERERDPTEATELTILARACGAAKEKPQPHQERKTKRVKRARPLHGYRLKVRCS